MADTAFVDFTFTNGLTGGVARTMPARLTDIVNVGDFAPGNNDVAITAAITAAISRNGGIVYFPPKLYTINNPIVVSGSSNCALTLLGPGGDGSAFPSNGAILESGSGFNDYIIWVGHGTKTPIKKIEGLGFKHGSVGTGLLSTERPADGGTGMGCIYLGSGTAPMIINCTMTVGGGIGIFSAATKTMVSNCVISGGYNGLGGQTERYGIGCMLVDGCFIHGKMNSLGVGFCGVAGGVSLRDTDIEVGGNATVIGRAPIAFWNSTLGTPAVTAAGAVATIGPCVENMSYESTGLKFLDLQNITSGSFRGITLYSQGGVPSGLPTHGYYLQNVKNSSFRACGVNTGGYNTASWDLSGGSVAGNVFEACVADISSGTGVAFKNATSFSAGDNPNVFLGSFGTATGLLRAQLPPSPTTLSGNIVTVTDNNNPAWDTGTGTSNVGRPLGAGGGGFTVNARWNGSAWVIAS